MTLLAIDSSGLVASCALLCGDQLVAEYTLNYKKTHSQTLLPMIDEIVTMTETDLSSLDAIAVAAGPGSFTGLRIGSSTAKGLGLALDLPLVSVPTLEGLAANYFGYPDLVCPMMDARRDQVYCGIYYYEAGELKVVMDQTACPVFDLIERLNKEDRPVVVLGDGVPVYEEMLCQSLHVPWQSAPAHMSRQRAASVGRRAMDYLRQGKTETAAGHAPVYLRRSQAERELLARGGSLGATEEASRRLVP